MSAAPFASTLSVGGFAALSDAGVRSLGLVQGTSVVSLGYQQKPSRWMRGALSPQRLEYPTGAGQVYFPRGSLAVQQYLNQGGSYELEERTAALNDARTQALTRLGTAAREAGAFGVVNVRIRRGPFGHARHAFEFTAVGTAITSDRIEVDETNPVAIASVSGTEFWKLVESGVRPLGVVGGTSIVYVVSGYRTKSARFRASRRSYRNQEYGDYTQGFRDARLRAATRLRHEAIQLGASGVLGVSVDRTLKEQRDDNLILTVDLLGTAVASLEHGGTRPPVAYALELGKA